MPTEKKVKKSALTWLNLTLRSFLGVCDPVRIGFPTKEKSVSFTFPLGQTGQIECSFFLLLLLQMTQASTLLLISYGVCNAAVVINVCLFAPYGHQKVYMLMLYFKATCS